MCKTFLRRACHQAVSTLLEIKTSGTGPSSERSEHRHTAEVTHLRARTYSRALLLYITVEVSGDELSAQAGNKMLRTHDGKGNVLIEVIPSRCSQ